MATIDECFQKVKYIANKSGWNGYISPADFNLLWNRAELRFFNDKYKLYGSTKRIDDTLSKVLSPPIVITVDGAGSYTFPADMLHEAAITHTYNGTQVQVTEWMSDRLANKLSSSYDAPTAEFPIYVRYATTLQFYPITLGNALLTYLKQPVKSVWGYTLVANRPVYNAGTSVQPVWSENDLDQIVYMVLQDIGVNMRDGEMENFSQLEAKQTA